MSASSPTDANNDTRRPFALSTTQIGQSIFPNNNNDDDNSSDDLDDFDCAPPPNNRGNSQQSAGGASTNYNILSNMTQPGAFSNNNSMIVSDSTVLPDNNEHSASSNHNNNSNRPPPMMTVENSTSGVKPLLSLSPRLVTDDDYRSNTNEDDDYDAEIQATNITSNTNNTNNNGRPKPMTMMMNADEIKPEISSESPTRSGATNSSFGSSVKTKSPHLSNKNSPHAPARKVKSDLMMNNLSSETPEEGEERTNVTNVSSSTTSGQAAGRPMKMMSFTEEQHDTNNNNNNNLSAPPSNATSVRTSLSLNAEMLSRSRGHLRTHSGDHSDGENNNDDDNDDDPYGFAAIQNSMMSMNTANSHQYGDFLEAPTPSVGRGRKNRSNSRGMLDLSLTNYDDNSTDMNSENVESANNNNTMTTSELASQLQQQQGSVLNNNFGPPPLAPKRKARSNTKPPNHAEFRGWEVVVPTTHQQKSMAIQVEEMMAARRKHQLHLQQQQKQQNSNNNNNNNNKQGINNNKEMSTLTLDSTHNTGSDQLADDNLGNSGNPANGNPLVSMMVRANSGQSATSGQSSRSNSPGVTASGNHHHRKFGGVEDNDQDDDVLQNSASNVVLENNNLGRSRRVSTSSGTSISSSAGRSPPSDSPPQLDLESQNSNQNNNNNNNNNNKRSISIMSYNILAQRYVTTDKYGEYCKTTSLEQGYRVKNVVRQVAGCQPDILMMQEVATSLSEEGSQLRELLEEQGLDKMVHVTTTLADGRDRAEAELEKQKCIQMERLEGQAQAVSEDDDNTPTKSSVTKGNLGLIEGVSISWKSSRFDLVEEHIVKFNVLAEANISFQPHEKHLLKKASHNIANIVALRDKKNNNDEEENSSSSTDENIIIVASIHVYYDHSRRECQLWQLIKLTQAIEEMKQRLLNNESENNNTLKPKRNIHVILGGDFNCDWNKYPIEFLENGEAVVPATAFGEDDMTMHRFMASGGLVLGYNHHPNQNQNHHPHSNSSQNSSSVSTPAGIYGAGMFSSVSVGGGTNPGTTATSGNLTPVSLLTNHQNGNNNGNSNDFGSSNGIPPSTQAKSDNNNNNSPSTTAATSQYQLSHLPSATSFMTPNTNEQNQQNNNNNNNQPQFAVDFSAPPTPAKSGMRGRRRLSSMFGGSTSSSAQLPGSAGGQQQHQQPQAIQAPNVLLEAATASHSLELVSAYKNYCIRNPSHVSAHDVQTSFNGVIDLIFFQKSSFKMSKIGRIMSSIYAVPNDRDPSDHCPVAVTLEPQY